MTNDYSDIELLNPQALAELTGVQLNTVYIWRKRRKINGMPDPITKFGKIPQWKKEQIVQWLKATNRLPR